MVNYRLTTMEDIDNLVLLRIIFLQEAEEVEPSSPIEELKKSLYNYFKEKIPNKLFVSWLAEDEGKIIATSGLSFHVVPPSYENPSGEEAYLMNMYTLPEYRKQGIGGNLLDKTVNEAKKRGTRKIRLHTTDIGKPLYEKQAFVETKSELVLLLV